MTPGELIRTARRRHGISQQRLAARAGTTQSAISRLERDQISPTVETLSALLELVGHELKLDAERVDWGHDRSLLEEGLRLNPTQRVERAGSFGSFILDSRVRTAPGGTRAGG